MIKLPRSILHTIAAARNPAELHIWLQKAIELEHSTIPPYLTALFSLKPGTNDEIARLISSIVIEEMLHMTIAGNILIAIKGHPSINGPDFIPKYPGPLPLSIGGAGFIVGIEAFSMLLVENIFKVRESKPINLPTDAAANAMTRPASTGRAFADAIEWHS